MSRFVELMRYATGSTDTRKQLLSKIDDRRIVQLLQSEEIEKTTLIQEEVYKEVLAGAEPQICMREALPVIKMDRNALRYVMGEAGSYAPVIAEGAEIPIDTQNYTAVNFTVKKVGKRPLITRELIEDGLFDVAALEIRKASASVENRLNKDAVEMLLNSASATSVSTATADTLSVADIAKAIGIAKKNNFVPDTLILSAQGESTLLADSNLAYVNRAGDSEALRRGSIGTTLLGLKPYTTTVAAVDSTSHDFGGTDDGDCLAIVIDRTHAGAIGMRRDLTVDQYDDPIRDLEGMSITMRYDVKPFFGEAIVRINNLG